MMHDKFPLRIPSHRYAGWVDGTPFPRRQASQGEEEDRMPFNIHLLNSSCVGSGELIRIHYWKKGFRIHDFSRSDPSIMKIFHLIFVLIFNKKLLPFNF